MLDISQITEWQISLFIILLGALILYFGKLIADTKVEKYDKLGYYIEGLFFFIVYVTVPVLFAYSIRDVIQFPTWFCFFIQVTILSCLSWNLRANEYLRKHGLVDEVEKKARIKLKELKSSDTTKGKLIRKYEKIFKKRFGMDYVDLSILAVYKIPIKYFGNKYVLLLFSFLSVLSSMSLFGKDDVLLIAISLFITFFILSIIALAHGFRTAYYPPAKVYLENDKPIEGKILKFGEYVYLLKDNKKIFVNKDKVKYIEESLFKEKEKHD